MSNTLGTHDIQNITITDIINNELCIQFDLVIGWIIEVAYVHLVGDGDDITLSTNFTGAVSNEVHVYRCYANIPANTWTVVVSVCQ